VELAEGAEDASPAEASSRVAELREALGPALVTALEVAHRGDDRVRVVRAVGRLRYVPGVPVLLQALRAEPSRSYKAEIGEALATLRATAAIPELHQLLDASTTEHDWLSKEAIDSVRRSLQVLEGTWGEPADGWRFSVQAPPRVRIGARVEITVYAENVGDAMLDYAGAILGTVIVDGVAHPRNITVYDGRASFAPAEVIDDGRDVTPWLTSRGRHQVQYAAGRARSNELTIIVE
jgi:hypothetical protein